MTPKQAIFAAGEASGFSAMLGRSTWRTARLAILCYHGVSLDDEHAALPELYITVSQLRRRFEMLHRGGYSVLRLGEALDRLATGTLPPRSVALTFDDGTRDFATLAAPLLEEFGFPATVYVTTYYCEHPWPVFNTAMRYLLWRGRGSGVDLSDVFSASVHLADPGPPPWSELLETVASSSAADKQRMLEETAARIGLDFAAFLSKGQFAIMTPGQIAGLPRGLIDVQLHTHRHRTPRDRRIFAAEIKDNVASLERTVGTHARLVHFCYPSGDYAAAFIPWLIELGIKSAVTCVPGLANRKSNPLLLPRILDTSLTSDLSFRASVDGVADLLPRKREFRLQPDRD